MDSSEKHKILDNVKDWFKDCIANNHVSNIRKASSINDFNVNPFLVSYLAGVIDGELTAKAVAKALLYPRVLGTSITTSFGTNLQSLLSTAFKSYGSTTQGIDIEFIDAIDGRKKYCQLKLGPQTINKDDVVTIVGHFSSIQRLARTNNLDVRPSDLIVGILYGSRDNISANYKAIQDRHHYPVYIGQEFWQRFTGDSKFYQDFQKCINEVALEQNLHQELIDAVDKLSQEQAVKEIAGEI